MTLHDELDRIAARAPVADVPDDTWTRARTARSRDRALMIAGVVAALALLAGAVAWVPGQLHPPVADTDGSGALPAQLWYVQSTYDVEEATDLAVGPVAAAFIGDGVDHGRVIAVGARDGVYRSIDLPLFTGLDDVNASEQYLALSPDGTHLAYSWAARARRAGPTPTGVRIVDLNDGTIRTTRLAGGQGILVNRMSWSPDGRWLVWSGQVATEWRPGSRAFGDEEAAGLVGGPDPTSSTSVPTDTDPDGIRQYAVGDDGTVAMLDYHRITWWRDGAVLSRQAIEHQDSSYSSQAQVRDGIVLDLRMWLADGGQPGVPALVRHVEGRPGAIRGGQVDEGFQGAAPLGFDSTGAALVEARSTLDANQSVWQIRFTRDGAVPTELVSEEDGSLTGLTVAVDLPVEADVVVPAWVETDGRSPWWWLGGAAALAAGAYVVRRYRRSAR